jgi:tRNA dimethylallyltransferase
MAETLRDVLILTGPTGSGKTRLGIELAKRLDAEIISMDSMALYRGMDIGTAKPAQAERAQVPHHLLDVLDPWESASVAWWLKQAHECCERIRERGRKILFVGGTPLYLKALLRGLFEGPAGDRQVRARLEAEALERGSQSLFERLTRLDPISAQRIHPNDVRRMIRALEVLELTGRPISEWQQQWGREAGVRGQGAGARSQEEGVDTGPRAVWLDIPREELYVRINKRVEVMFTAGLVDEVRRLRDLPQPLSREAGQALGYKEISAFLDGTASLEDTLREVQTRSRNFAKRQVTWFRHLSEVQPATPELTEALWKPTIT